MNFLMQGFCFGFFLFVCLKSDNKNVEENKHSYSCPLYSSSSLLVSQPLFFHFYLLIHLFKNLLPPSLNYRDIFPLSLLALFLSEISEITISPPVSAFTVCREKYISSGCHANSIHRIHPPHPPHLVHACV